MKEVKSIFDTTNQYHKEGNYPMFCSHPVALLDMINSPYPEVFAFYEKQMAQNWKWDEVALGQDRIDMLTANKEYVDLMVDTLLYQWSIDSVASNTILPLFAPFISSPEVHMLFTEVTRMECLTPDHDVLTTDGWKPIAEVTTEDKVAQWEYETGEITFVKPSHTIEKFHEGDMYHFTSINKDIDQLVTPNHRIPLVYPYPDAHSAAKSRLAHEVNLHGHNAVPIAGTAKKGRGMTDFERLLVAVQADGSLADASYTGSTSGKKHYKFGLSKQRKIDRLFEVCKGSGLEVVEYGLGRGDGLRLFYVKVPVDIYEERAKTFDWFNLEDISYEWAEDFVEELSHWDGNKTLHGLVRYCNTNKEAVEKAFLVGRLAGYRSRIYTVPERDGVVFPSGNISSTKESYQVAFNNTPHLLGNVIKKEKVQYSGYVYCLTVPSSYFVVRRNGSVSVTGNCIHANTYSHIVQQTMQNPREALNKAMSLQESITRGGEIVEVFDHLALVGGRIRAGLLSRDSKEAKEAVFLGMVNLYILEQISFMSSFAVTFAISELGIFQGIGKLVALIARDEHHVHAAADKVICQTMIKQMPDTYRAVKHDIKQMIDEAVQIELDWNKYLFEGRSCVGLTRQLLDDWVHFMSKDIYKTFNLEPKVLIEENPLPYMEYYLDLGSTQNAPQESDITDYLIGGVESTLGDEELDF